MYVAPNKVHFSYIFVTGVEFPSSPDIFIKKV
jgi:hypothetical protein